MGRKIRGASTPFLRDFGMGELIRGCSPGMGEGRGTGKIQMLFLSRGGGHGRGGNEVVETF